jgi:hypothetical protein
MSSEFCQDSMTNQTDNDFSVDSRKNPRQHGRRSHSDAFDTEAELVREFLTKLQGGRSPWGPVDTAVEWDYRSGVADILARNHSRDLIAFEAKLSNWRRACHQAYRSTAYADVAYVVLPENVASRAAKESEVFARYGVGLVSCSVRRISVLIEAKACEPLVRWLTIKAHATFDQGPNDTSCRLQRRSKRSLQAA